MGFARKMWNQENGKEVGDMQKVRRNIVWD